MAKKLSKPEPDLEQEIELELSEWVEAINSHHQQVWLHVPHIDHVIIKQDGSEHAAVTGGVFQLVPGEFSKIKK